MIERKNKLVFSWVFPEITILAHVYGIKLYNDLIGDYSGVGNATLEFVKRLLKLLNKNYDIQDALVFESYILSIVSGLMVNLQDTSLSYFNKNVDILFNDIIKDSNRGYIEVLQWGKVPTEDALSKLSEYIDIMICKAIKSFETSLQGEDIRIFSIGRNVIIEYNDLDKCTIIETLIQCSKIRSIQFLPHII